MKKCLCQLGCRGINFKTAQAFCDVMNYYSRMLPW
jgi:hypothetical protein